MGLLIARQAKTPRLVSQREWATFALTGGGIAIQSVAVRSVLPGATSPGSIVLIKRLRYWIESGMDNGPDVVCDGIIYCLQSHGGISRIYDEILPRMCELDDSLSVTLVTQGRCAHALPAHRRITRRAIPHIERYLRPGRLWRPIIPWARRVAIWACLGHAKGRIWHSTYYTRPVHWDGVQVVTVVDMVHERFPNLFVGVRHDQFREQKRRCVLSADAVICISETTRQDVLQYYDIDVRLTYVIPLAYSDVFAPLDNAQVPLARPFLLYVGRRHAYKQFWLLVETYARWMLHTEVSLAVVGPPWSLDEQRRLTELGVVERVHLLPDVSDGVLCALYNQAVAFVYPSLYEGFGIPLLEAMACGCPVVASKIPSTIEVAGQCPIYFEPGRQESLRAALDRALLEGRDVQRTRLGRERVCRYSWDETAKRTLGVYRALSYVE